MQITQHIRQFVAASPKSQLAIAKESGVPQPRISEFLRGHRVYSDTVDKLHAWMEKEQLRESRKAHRGSKK